MQLGQLLDLLQVGRVGSRTRWGRRCVLSGLLLVLIPVVLVLLLPLVAPVLLALVVGDGRGSRSDDESTPHAATHDSHGTPLWSGFVTGNVRSAPDGNLPQQG